MPAFAATAQALGAQSNTAAVAQPVRQDEGGTAAHARAQEQPLPLAGQEDVANEADELLELLEEGADVHAGVNSSWEEKNQEEEVSRSSLSCCLIKYRVYLLCHPAMAAHTVWKGCEVRRLCSNTGLNTSHPLQHLCKKQPSDVLGRRMAWQLRRHCKKSSQSRTAYLTRCRYDLSTVSFGHCLSCTIWTNKHAGC